MLSQAEELNGFSYRPNERKLINQILTAVQETAINKVHGLLLLHINRLPVPHDLAYEIKQILPELKNKYEGYPGYVKYLNDKIGILKKSAMLFKELYDRDKTKAANKIEYTLSINKKIYKNSKLDKNSEERIIKRIELLTKELESIIEIIKDEG